MDDFNEFIEINFPQAGLNFSVYYVDDDGDRITVNCQEDIE
jgi:hypothetical protein